MIFKKEDSWTGYYYPDGCLGCEESYIFSPTSYDTQEACLAWAQNLKQSRNNKEDLYECGLNCKKKDGFNVCKETVD